MRWDRRLALLFFPLWLLVLSTKAQTGTVGTTDTPEDSSCPDGVLLYTGDYFDFLISGPGSGSGSWDPGEWLNVEIDLDLSLTGLPSSPTSPVFEWVAADTGDVRCSFNLNSYVSSGFSSWTIGMFVEDTDFMEVYAIRTGLEAPTASPEDWNVDDRELLCPGTMIDVVGTLSLRIGFLGDEIGEIFIKSTKFFHSSSTGANTDETTCIKLSEYESSQAPFLHTATNGFPSGACTGDLGSEAWIAFLADLIFYGFIAVCLLPIVMCVCYLNRSKHHAPSSPYGDDGATSSMLTPTPLESSVSHPIHPAPPKSVNNQYADTSAIYGAQPNISPAGGGPLALPPSEARKGSASSNKSNKSPKRKRSRSKSSKKKGGKGRSKSRSRSRSTSKSPRRGSRSSIRKSLNGGAGDERLFGAGGGSPTPMSAPPVSSVSSHLSTVPGTGDGDGDDDMASTRTGATAKTAKTNKTTSTQATTLSSVLTRQQMPFE